MTDEKTKEAIRRAVEKLVGLSAAHEWRPPPGVGEGSDPRRLHERVVIACQTLREAGHSGTGMAFAVGPADDGVEVMLPLRAETPALDLFAILGWVAMTYEPTIIGIAAPLVGGAVPIKLAIEVPKTDRDGHPASPGYVVATTWGCPRHGSHSATTIISADGQHAFHTKTLGGGDPYLTIALGNLFESAAEARKETTK